MEVEAKVLSTEADEQLCETCLCDVNDVLSLRASIVSSRRARASWYSNCTFQLRQKRRQRKGELIR